MTEQNNVPLADLTTTVESLSQIRMLQLTMGTGIAGAVIENGRPWSHLCEPGKVCLNVVPPGGFLFPHGLAANNQLAKAALERVGRRLLDLPDELPLEVRWLATIGNDGEAPPALKGRLPSDASRRSREVFRLLGRGLGDLIVTLMPHINFGAVGLAGGPLKGMPSLIADEIRTRCAKYGYDVTRIAPDVPVFLVNRPDERRLEGRLTSMLRSIAENADEYSADLLNAMIGCAEQELLLIDDDDIRETVGRYVPVGAYRLIMDELRRCFPDAPSFNVEFDGRPFASVPIPVVWKASDAVNSFLAKYPCAVVVNQAMTAGFQECNYLTASTIAATTAALPLTTGHRYAFEGTPYATGLGVISTCYYSTWKGVCAATHPISGDSVHPSARSTVNESEREVAVGIDIGGSNIKMVVLIRSEPCDPWMICTHQTSVPTASTSVVEPHADASTPLLTSASNPLDEFATDTVIQAPDADIDTVATTLVRRIQRLTDQVAPGVRIVKVGIVFPAAVANGVAAGATSRIAGSFAGQTTSIMNANANQLLKLDVVPAFQRAWMQSGHSDRPTFQLANDGPASTFGSFNAVFGRPAAISAVAEPEGGFGAFGVAQL